MPQEPEDGLFSPERPSNSRDIERAPTDDITLRQRTPATDFNILERPPTDDITVRQRVATIDFDILERSGAVTGQSGTVAERTADEPERLNLNLFDDTVLTAIVERTVPTRSGYALWGRIEGVEGGTMTLVVNGTVVAGSVQTLSGEYRIQSVGDQLYAISQIDEAKLPPVD